MRIACSVLPFPVNSGSRYGRRRVLWMWTLGAGWMGIAAASVLTATALSGQSGSIGADTTRVRPEASTSASVLQALRPPPPVAPLDIGSGFLDASWDGSRPGFVAGESLLFPERMDFWSGAFVGGMVAYHDPFRRYRNDDRRVRRTIFGALFGGLSGQPISQEDLFRHRRPPIETRLPPHPRW